MRAPFVSTLHIAALAGLIAAALAGCASAPPPRAAANAASAAESVAAAASVTEAPAATASAATPPAGTAMAAADTAASAPAAIDSGAAAVAPGGADEAVPLERRFADWVAQFRTDAQAQGIADATLSAALDDVHYLPRVVELDRAQPEFTRSVWDYLDITVSPQRVTRGQARLQQVRASADDAAARYGVPATVLAAIWGIESNFGELMGSTSTIDALATLGFDGRRAGWARSELLAALKILQSGDVDRAHMVGSWAGAMGHTQLLPSNVLLYAVDADGDGRRDIWTSAVDALASTANFLARAGWRSGEPWGTEVQLPAGFDVGRADGALRLSSAQWAADGVRTADGSPLPALDEGAILLPAGARGPAFLVGPNFRVIQRYNNSISYALAVSLLAQRLAGGPAVQGAWPRDLAALSRAQVVAMQSALNARGFDSGAPDGLPGPATRDALRRYQRSIGVAADGYPTLQLLQQLQGD
jgi:lytic murein transglycosylase